MKHLLFCLILAVLAAMMYSWRAHSASIVFASVAGFYCALVIQDVKEWNGRRKGTA